MVVVGWVVEQYTVPFTYEMLTTVGYINTPLLRSDFRQQKKSSKVGKSMKLAILSLLDASLISWQARLGPLDHIRRITVKSGRSGYKICASYGFPAGWTSLRLVSFPDQRKKVGLVLAYTKVVLLQDFCSNAISCYTFVHTRRCADWGSRRLREA